MHDSLPLHTIAIQQLYQKKQTNLFSIAAIITINILTFLYITTSQLLFCRQSDCCSFSVHAPVRGKIATYISTPWITDVVLINVLLKLNVE
jgi:hypothetical protein